MIEIEHITPGESYACKFRVVTMLDTLGRPAPNLSDEPLKGPGVYEGVGILVQRDTEKRLVKLQDEKTGNEFICSWDDCWDVDTVEWKDNE
jgi:hypothetical protein